MPKNQKLYYKVVYRDNNRLYSALAPCSMKIIYVPKQSIKTSYFGKLCCFDTLENAKVYLDKIKYGTKKYECWICTIGKIYKYSGIPRYSHSISSYDYIHGMNQLQKLAKNKKKYTHLIYPTDRFPEGTVFTDEICLLYQVNIIEGTK